MNENQYNLGYLGQESPRTDGSLWIVAAVTLGVIALVLVASFPVLTAAVLVGAVTSVALVWVGLAAVARRTTDAIDELEVPGVGTVEVRVLTR